MRESTTQGTSDDGTEQLRELTVGRHRVTVSIRGLAHGTVPLLLCNGIGAEYRVLGELRRHLRRTSVALDVQGVFLGVPPTVRTYAKFLAGVVNELGFDSVDVLGLSWGGIVAQQLARDHPQLVRRLILAGSTPGFVSVPAKARAALSLVTPRRDPRSLRNVFPRLCGGDFLRDAELPEKLGLLRLVDGPTYRRQLLALTGWSSLPWLSKLRHETLILHGSDDPLVPVVNARIVTLLMPNSSLHIVRDGGHLFLYTRPEELGSRIADFLEEPQRVGSTRGLPWRRSLRVMKSMQA